MTMKKELVYAEYKEGGIQLIFMNQPEKKNAISAPMMDILTELLHEADKNDAVRVIVLRGSGDVFSSGGDLGQTSPEEQCPELARKTLKRYERAVQTIRSISKPLIAMVDGFAVGGAFALTLAADLVCASDRALFVPAFCQIGIIPEMGIMKFLPELVGPQRAKEILFLGGKFSGEKMYELGLVNRVFSAEKLEERTMELARDLAKMPDASIQITKGIMNSFSDGDLDALLEAEMTASPFCTTTSAYAKTMEQYAL